MNVILYINEYKNIRYYGIFKKLRTYPFILQQYSRTPSANDLASYYKIKILRYLPRSAYFVLSVYELETLRSLKLGRYIKLRPIGVDVHKIQLINPKTRCKIRQRPLAALTVFNVGHATALTILGYVTAWCPCVFARRPERFAELTWAALPGLSFGLGLPSGLYGHMR
jgi:hypothetical protein